MGFAWVQSIISTEEPYIFKLKHWEKCYAIAWIDRRKYNAIKLGAKRGCIKNESVERPEI